MFWYILVNVSLNDCRPAPKLKDVELSESKARELYLQCIQIMRVMYQESKLVHADLSEFNMLWVQSTGKPYIHIDKISIHASLSTKCY